VFSEAAPVYERDVLHGDEGVDRSGGSASGDGDEDVLGMTSDSENVSLEPMVIESLDFLKAVLDCHIGKVAKLMLRAAKVPDFLHLMVRYMQMKDADAFKAEVSGTLSQSVLVHSDTRSALGAPPGLSTNACGLCKDL
jgi:hypothetical protein